MKPARPKPRPDLSQTAPDTPPAGLLSSLMIGQLASQITGGGAGGGIMGMIGQAGQSLSKFKEV